MPLTFRCKSRYLVRRRFIEGGSEGGNGFCTLVSFRFFHFLANSSSGSIILEDNIQLFAPTSEGYFGNIITKGTIEAQTEDGHFSLATADGRRSTGTNIT